MLSNREDLAVGLQFSLRHQEKRVIAMVPQVGVRPAAAKTQAAAAPPDESFADHMGQMTQAADASHSKPAEGENTNTPSSAARKESDRSSKPGSDKKLQDPQTSADQPASASIANVPLPQTAPANIVQASILPAALPQTTSVVATESSLVPPPIESSDKTPVAASGNAFPIPSFSGTLQHESKTNALSATTIEVPNAKDEAKKLTEPAEEKGDGAENPVSSHALPGRHSEPALSSVDKVPLQTHAVVPSPISASRADRSQATERAKETQPDAAKPAQETNGPDIPQSNNIPPQPSPAMTALGTSLAPSATDLIAKTVGTKVEELKTAAIDPHQKTNPKKAFSPDSRAAQSGAKASSSKQEIGTRTGKEERKDDDPDGSLQDAQPASTDAQKSLLASQQHSTVPQAIHGAGSGGSAKEQTMLAPKDSGPAAHAQAVETIGPDSATDPALLYSAKLSERLGQSELRVGIQTGEFGNVDIRTSMTRNQLTAEISVEHGELGRMLAAELPGLQNKLAEHRFPQANLVLQSQTSGSFSDSGQRSGNWQRTPAMQNAVNSYALEERPESGGFTPTEMSGQGKGLDIHM
ncbi:MAG: flagellar hook-length control protein FliK [Terriglobales bacterium]